MNKQDFQRYCFSCYKFDEDNHWCNRWEAAIDDCNTIDLQCMDQGGDVEISDGVYVSLWALEQEYEI